ncbi:hypothetical protein [Phocaeicola vulgatus]|uniref:Uncharacterized protein n=1 Tax=Phocaeicola vulgatus TaxID=821 RepID=A0AAE4L0N3_PHOVU|nr:hypothetical protein [Phocaeicola vulgatus]MDU0242481.1 hypothetical protein [Phocaeicola vulgatus]
MFRKKRKQSPQRYWQESESHTLMQEVTLPLTSPLPAISVQWLTEETEVASVENNIPDTHLRYTKVD